MKSNIFHHDEQGTRILMEFKKRCGILGLNHAQTTKPEREKCFGNISCQSKKSSVSQGTYLFLQIRNSLLVLDGDMKQRVELQVDEFLPSNPQMHRRWSHPVKVTRRSILMF